MKKLIGTMLAAVLCTLIPLGIPAQAGPLAGTASAAAATQPWNSAPLHASLVAQQMFAAPAPQDGEHQPISTTGVDTAAEAQPPELRSLITTADGNTASGNRSGGIGGGSSGSGETRQQQTAGQSNNYSSESSDRQQGGSGGGGSKVDLAAYAREVFRLVNVERRKAGLNEVVWDEDLSMCADIRAEEMSIRWGHVRPGTTGSTYNPYLVADELGVPHNWIMENAGAGYATPDAVAKGWMNSSGHRANILKESHTRCGVGVYFTTGSTPTGWTKLWALWFDNYTGGSGSGGSNNNSNNNNGGSGGSGSDNPNPGNNSGEGMEDPEEPEEPDNPGSDLDGIDTWAYADELARLINGKRTASGRQAYTLENVLTNCAITRADEISRTYSYTRPNGTSGANYAVTSAGAMGGTEIIGRAGTTPSEMLAAWLAGGESSSLLSDTYESFGIGCTVVDGEIYWVVSLVHYGTGSGESDHGGAEEFDDNDDSESEWE